MSRIGRAPIAVPAGVVVTIADGNVVTVKGPLGELTQTFHKALTNDLELLREAFGNTFNHVGKKGSGKTVKCAVFLLVIGTGYGELVTLLCDGELSVEGLIELAEGALYGNNVAVCNGYGHACGNYDRFSTNS